ncbi:VIT1/CCC1 transporter family protein [Nocardioides sp.]|uniref:VIT1/CCC1 transporter family protein n=1 Tax=Nocardioides sp. TaxID=35761 RepID=UPI00273327B0|nr:VIT1/CCC1 transporter family protein [Nocardioides sp.]MDP3892113.1 VIT1/CCC1 transporter family protein [Nocardioides sp.]
MTIEDLPDVGHEHADLTGGWLRPAVFGAMDGLVSNAALIAGVAGGTRGTDDTSAVVLAGLAGLAAGAFSMAAGEYASVASESESAELEVRRERDEILAHPDIEQAELAQMLVERGLDPATAEQVASEVHQDPEAAVSVHAQMEFGVDPDDLSSPVVAAVSSFVAFSIGALVPLVPYLLGGSNVLVALGLTLLALFGCGALVTRVTSRSWWFGGLRQVALGLAAFVATYGIGALVGAQL